MNARRNEFSYGLTDARPAKAFITSQMPADWVVITLFEDFAAVRGRDYETEAPPMVAAE